MAYVVRIVLADDTEDVVTFGREEDANEFCEHGLRFGYKIFKVDKTVYIPTWRVKKFSQKLE
jgi:hypothetical protein